MICSRLQEKLNNAFYELLLTCPLEEIRVKDLIDKANVSKSTFYSTYSNMDDFILEQINNIFYLIHGDESLFRREDGSSKCVFIKISEMLYENRTFLKAIYGSVYKKELFDNIDYMFRERLYFCFNSNECSTEELSYKMIFLSSGYKGLIDKYIETGDEVYLKYSANILQETIESYALSCKSKMFG